MGLLRAGLGVALLALPLGLISGCARHRERKAAAVAPAPAPAAGAAKAIAPVPPVVPPPAHVTSDPRTVTPTRSENVVHANAD